MKLPRGMCQNRKVNGYIYIPFHNGVTNDDKDYRSTIITSLPNFLSNFASSLLANMRLHAATGIIDPDQFIFTVDLAQ